MYIESFDRFDAVATFDPSTGRLVESSRAAFREGHGPPSGHYARLAGTLAVLYRDGGVLHLRLGDYDGAIESRRARVRWSHDHGVSSLTVIEHGATVAEVEYRPGPLSVAGDPTPFVESEDWDFGLFVRNVLADGGRSERIYGGRPPTA